ncbi:GNAT family N-acetyltransferase [Ruegeria sp. 2012CJ41-6]|uniref:GNAT family N-acetyltransferase n=1 Tax=Ruegeria spongiae TaxID=2942209 RepID=A0ABT0Q9K3_9RHOB|nr:GNAT family N-acetyltransferase [Ruegeria spongiae]MCL6285853.1 GNAT family N-acetyltransferase [Ruegeria spongiae]
MPFTLRHAHQDDAPALHAILTSPHVVRGSMRLPFMPLKTTEDRLAHDRNRLQLVALDGNSIVGFIELLMNSGTPRAAHSAEVNLVATREEDQEKGVARALMEAIIASCDTHLSIRRLSLIVWLDNTRAIALYKALGFQEEGRMLDFVRTETGYGDAIMMARICKRH